MSWRTILGSLGLRARPSTRRQRSGAATIRRELELLEDRCVPAIVGTAAQNFVAQTYLDLLQRPVEPFGLAVWTRVLDQGGAPIDVARGLVVSQEFRTNEINLLYQRFLHRAPDAPGFTSAMTLLQNGASR